MLPYPSRQNKSKKPFILVITAAAAIFAGYYFFTNNSFNEEVVAKVNGQKIYRFEIEMRLKDVFESQEAAVKTPDLEKLPQEIVEILAKEVYLERELTKEALKSKAAKTKEIKAKIADVKNKILRQAYIDSILKEEVTEEKINNKYLELTKELEGKKEYQISHIVFKTKEEADKIAKELHKKPAKFGEFAKKYSIDQSTANKDGNLDYVLEDSLIKEVAAVIPNLKKDEISDPILTKFGWHLVKITDIRDAKPLSFEAVKENIKDQLIQDRVNQINNKIIDKAKIQILIKLKENGENNNSKNSEESSVTEEKPASDISDKTATESSQNSITNNLNSAEESETKTEEITKEEPLIEEEDDTKKSQENKTKANAKHKKHKAKSKRQ
ncbi:MAG: peptidylprolyl isomerase [Rickettsiales bacterium]|nr:peptidylprolyl isomerase [Rickettsiales bacterium]